MSNLRIVLTNPTTLGSVLDLADEATTRRHYEWFRKQPNSPRLTFEQYALAYGEKKLPDETEIRAAYDRLLSDLKSAFPGVEGELYGQPTFEEFKEAYGHE